jgi:hypothetical protein
MISSTGAINSYGAQPQAAPLELYGAVQVRFAGHELIDIHRAYLHKLAGILGYREPAWNRSAYDGGIGKQSTQRAKELLKLCYEQQNDAQQDSGLAATLRDVLGEYEQILAAKLRECASFWKPSTESSEMRDLLLQQNFAQSVNSLQLPHRVAELVKDCASTGVLDLSGCDLSTLHEYQLDGLLDALKRWVPGLRTLSLYNTRLTRVPQSMGDLKNLSHLNLGVNQLSSVPETLGNLTGLRELNLGGNQLSRLPETLGNLTRLSRLNLGYNALPSLPESFGNLTELRLLNMERTRCSYMPARLAARIASGQTATSIERFSQDWMRQDINILTIRIQRLNDPRPMPRTDNSLKQSVLGLGLADKAPTWARYENETSAQCFSAWLLQLKDTEDGRRNRTFLQGQVKKLLDAMEQDDELRARCFSKAADFTSTCHDNVAWGLFAFSLDIRNRRIELAGTSGAELVRQGRDMCAASLIEQAARARGDEIRKTSPRFNEDLEIALVYALKLKKFLPVEVPIMEIKYGATGANHTTEEHVDALRVKIERIKQDSLIEPEFLSFLSAWPPLHKTLAHRNPEAGNSINAIEDHAQEKIALLYLDNEMPEPEKLAAYEKVRLERENALQELATGVTRAYLEELGFSVS